MSVRFEPNKRGIAELLRSPQVGDALADVAEQVAERVRATMPVGSRDPRGELRESVHVEKHRLSVDGKRITARVVADADYAAAVEFGNSRVSGQAPMRRAVE